MRMLDLLALADADGIDVDADVGERATAGRALPVADSIGVTATLMYVEQAGHDTVASRMVMKAGKLQRREAVTSPRHTTRHDGSRVSNIQCMMRAARGNAIPDAERAYLDMAVAVADEYDLTALRLAATSPARTGATLDVQLPGDLARDVERLKELAALINHQTGDAVMCQMKNVEC